MMKNLLFIFLTIAGTSVVAQHNKLTLEDIWLHKKFEQEKPHQIKHLNSDRHYSYIDSSQNFPDTALAIKNIVIAEYETGKVTDYIFKPEWAPDSLQPFYFKKYKLSDNDSLVLLSVEEEKIYRRSTREQYYIWDRNEKKLTKLTTGAKQMYADFSPDNQKVAYVQLNNLYYKELTTGKITQVTYDGNVNEIINGASDWVYEEELVMTRAFEWSPDSRKIAFIRFDESQVRQITIQKGGQLYPVQYTYKYPKAGEQNSIVTVHTYFLQKNNIKKLELNTDPEDYIPRIKWTKDPDVLSVQRLNRKQNKLDLILVNVANGNKRTVLTETSKYYIEITDDLKFLKGGNHFLWTSEQDGYNHIYLFNMDGRLEKQITQGKWEVTDLVDVDQKNNIIYYQSTEASPMERHIYSIDYKGKSKKRITSKPGFYDADFSDEFSYYFLEYTGKDTPIEVNVYNGQHQQVSGFISNEKLKALLSEYKAPNKEFFQFTTSENIQLNGWMIKPNDFDPNKKYPVIMFVYGGPGSQKVADDWDERHGMWFRYLAQQGYIVASVDNRGTGARGVEFRSVTYKNLGYYETLDQIEAGKYLAGLDYVDGDRIGIFGWSYGGYMSSLALFKAPEVFKLGIAVAPVTDWRYYDTIYTERFMQRPQDNPEGYDRAAPLTYADQLEGNYMLVHGTADDNVHFQNSLELISKLVNANKDFELLIYPDKDHSIKGEKTRLHLYSRMTEFIHENL